MSLLVRYNGDQDKGELQAAPGAKTQTVMFQHGPVKANGVNGIQNEQVIELLLLRLRDLDEKFPCRENIFAIIKLDEALMWLERRTKLRVEQGVEGINTAHKP